MNVNNLQIVVLEDLKDFWHISEIRELYCDLMKVKFQGYGTVYGDNVISSDKADFFGTHLIVCEKGIRLKPLFGYKSVTLEKCEQYHLRFPALSLVSSDGHDKCLLGLQEIINTAVTNKEQISFDYSWAQAPELKENRTKEMAQLFRDLIMTLVISHHRDHDIAHMITCGVVKVKTDRFFKLLGLKTITSHSLFSQKDLNDEMVHIFHTKKYSNHAYEIAKKYQQLWSERIEYSKSTGLPIRRTAA